MDDTSDNRREDALAVAQLLDANNGGDTVVLDVGEAAGFTDYFVITTVTSAAHLRGLVDRLTGLFGEREMDARTPPRRGQDAGWVLVDCGYLVIHLMTEELRSFYELERLWFTAPVVFGSVASEES